MKKMKLSSKLYLGFAAVVLLLVIGTANSFWAINSLDAAGTDAIKSGENAVFLVAKEGDHLKWINTVMDLFLRNAKALHVTIDPTKCGLGKFLYGEGARKLAATDPQLAKLLEEIKGPHARLHKSAATIGKMWKQNHPGLALTLSDRLDDHRRWAASLAGSIMKRTEITVQLDPNKCAFGKWLAGEDSRKLRAQWPAFNEIMSKVVTHHDKLHASAAKIKGELEEATQHKIYFNETQPALAKVASLFMQAKELERGLGDAQKAAHKVFDTKTIPALNATGGILTKMVGIVNEQVKQAGATKKSTAEFTQWTAGLVAGIGILVGCLLAFFLTRAITKPINRVVAGLSAGAEQVSAASGQVSSSSQSLAEGASEQASALEETSASLEEMASMTKQNADNAQQADGLMKDAAKVVSEANASMGKLKSAMEKIDAASGETAKIIKTIDEIAFQTNLLALNAAVEAARAGEAGAGFAVVADEVRNLAMRAAEAAKNTQALIEENINNIKLGSEMVTATDESFSEVETNTLKVGELVAEIAGASAEQSQGIDQINTAATEMDRVTQQVASNAEESAAASEELSAQALTMNGHVNELASLIGGAKGANGSAESAGSDGRGTREPHAALPGPGNSQPVTHKQITSGSKRASTPQEIIPLDDKDFADF